MDVLSDSVCQDVFLNSSLFEIVCRTLGSVTFRKKTIQVIRVAEQCKSSFVSSKWYSNIGCADASSAGASKVGLRPWKWIHGICEIRDANFRTCATWTWLLVAQIATSPNSLVFVPMHTLYVFILKEVLLSWRCWVGKAHPGLHRTSGCWITRTYMCHMMYLGVLLFFLVPSLPPPLLSLQRWYPSYLSLI